MSIRRHGNCGNTIFDAECVDKLAFQDVPKAYSLVATARGNIAAIASKVERVDILLVSGEYMLD